MKHLGEIRSAWLAAFDWDAVTQMNESLCKVHGALHRPTSDGHDACREFWQARFGEKMTFRQALDVLLACHRMAPFCFNNGKTLSAIARTMILQLDLSASAAVVRSAAGHYVAGVLPDHELDAILSEVGTSR